MICPRCASVIVERFYCIRCGLVPVWAIMNKDFDYCFSRLIEIEGGYVSDPDDPGGATKYGISRLAAPDLDIEHLTLEEAKNWYWENYWNPLGLYSIADRSICCELLEAAVHLDPPKSPRRATQVVQGALILLGAAIKFDGDMGEKTIAAINGYAHPATLLKLMNGLQLAALLVGAQGKNAFIELVRARKPALRKYLRGWLRRIEL